MYSAQTCWSCVLKSMLRCWTAARRATSAAAFDVGLASIDWQMCAAFQVPTANGLVFRMFQRLKMFGIDITWMRASGRLADSVFIAVWTCERKSLIEVMVAGDEVQTSLAPMRISTRSGLPGIAFSASVLRLAAFAPVIASLPRVALETVAAGLMACNRFR